jgi:hypothetical protein
MFKCGQMTFDNSRGNCDAGRNMAHSLSVKNNHPL